MLPQAGWATASARDHKDGSECPAVPINALLGRQVWLAGWPTAMAGSPATDSYNAAGNTDASRRTVKLVDWSNATASLPGPARRTASGVTLTGSSAAMAAGGPLNPEHSRWLMGYPAEWGSCGATAMRSCRRSRRNS
jgi:ribosome modulation factor